MSVNPWVLFRSLLGAFVLAGSFVSAFAANSEEDTLKRVQQAKYNFVSGVWQIRMNEEIRDIEKGFKTYLPGLDYTLVDEKIKDSDRMAMTFRGMGDKKLVVKVKSQGIFTILSIRLGLTGNENKSAQIFSFVYRRM